MVLINKSMCIHLLFATNMKCLEPIEYKLMKTLTQSLHHLPHKINKPNKVCHPSGRLAMILLL